MGLELTDRFHVLAGGDDANLAGLSGAVQENDDE